ncbi:hypothetical protein ACFFRR_007735 [Megaselia abdita]
MQTFIYTVLIVSQFLSIEAAKYTCHKSYCKEYLIRNDCRPLDEPCLDFIENNNRSGTVYTDVHPCGCCNVCLEDINEDDYCTQGTLALVPPYQVCGAGLTCKSNQTTDYFQCSEDPDVPCIQERKLYKESLRNIIEKPFCDGDGNYFPFKCNVNQSCFCVNDIGERIFGELPYNNFIKGMPSACQCSRFHDQLKKSALGFKRPSLIARCTDDGGFDPLQCFEENCYCVEPTFGYYVSGPYNMTALYNNYKSLPCFNYTIHHTNTYLHDCERPFYELHRQMNHLQANGFDFEVERLMKKILKLPKCDPNGWYPPNNGEGKCMDKYNEKVLESNAGTSSCNCPRTAKLLEKSEPPTCIKGDYNEKCQDPTTGLFDIKCLLATVTKE